MPNHRRSPRTLIFSLALVAGLALPGCEGKIGDPAVADAGRPADAPSGPPVDAPLPPTLDAALPPVPDAPLPPATCDEIYGTSIEYILCAEQPDTCEFNVRTNGGNCDQLCFAFGGACVAAYDNVSDPGLECDRVVATGDDCTTTRNTEICVCTRF